MFITIGLPLVDLKWWWWVSHGLMLTHSLEMWHECQQMTGFDHCAMTNVR